MRVTEALTMMAAAAMVAAAEKYLISVSRWIPGIHFDGHGRTAGWASEGLHMQVTPSPPLPTATLGLDGAASKEKNAATADLGCLCSAMGKEVACWGWRA